MTEIGQYLASLPPIWREDPLPSIRADTKGTALVVFDDDPTGTQTVRNALVVTGWDQSTMSEIANRPGDLSFVLTNSRSLPEPDAVRISHQIASRLRHACDEMSLSVSLVSRSDSTLRGHYPAEVDSLASEFGQPDAKILFAPYFGDAGRLTIRGTHYIRSSGRLQPVGASEFARDPVFGYRSSRIRDWLAERGGGRVRPVAELDLETIRSGGPEGVRDLLVATPPASVIIVNAVAERDIEVVAAAAAQAERQGEMVIARTAASYVRARAGQPVHPLLDAAELGFDGPGLVVFGSHTDVSNKQFEFLMAFNKPDIAAFEIPIGSVLPTLDHDRLSQLSGCLTRHIRSGRMAVLVTDRESHLEDSLAAQLQSARRFSDALVAVVKALDVSPGWILAKGGITSSDLATKALSVRRARVRGQVLPGVSLWDLGGEGRFPGMPYVVFPGNVGDAEDVARVVKLLAGS